MITQFLWFCLFFSVSHSLCTSLIYNTTCSSECGQGKIKSVTISFSADPTQNCPFDDVVTYYPCTGNVCLEGQKCISGMCLPQWHWHYPQLPDNQTYHSEHLNITNNLFEHSTKLFYHQSAWIKFIIFQNNFEVTWSQDGMTWINKTIMSLPENAKQPNSFSSSNIFYDKDEDTGFMYVTADYTTKTFNYSICLWIVYGPGNFSTSEIILDNDNYNSIDVKIFKGELLYFYTMNSMLYCRTLNGSVWSIPLLDNFFASPKFSIGKFSDSLLISQSFRPIEGGDNHLFYTYYFLSNKTITTPKFVASIGNIRTLYSRVSISGQKNDLRILAWIDTNNDFKISVSNNSDWSNNITSTLNTRSDLYFLSLNLEFGSNNTIIILITANSANNPFHTKDVLFTMSIDGGEHWSPIKNIVASKTFVTTISDEASSIASDGNGKWLSIWIQKNDTDIKKFGFKEATSFFYLDLNCLNNDLCYSFDGESIYPPRNIIQFPIDLPNGNILILGYDKLTVLNSTEINGNITISQSNIIIQGDSRLTVKGDLKWSFGTLVLNGTDQFIQTNCVDLDHLSLQVTNKVIDKQSLFKIVYQSGCKKLSDLKINGEDCLSATPNEEYTNDSLVIANYFATQTKQCYSSLRIEIIVPTVVFCVIFILLVAVFIYKTDFSKRFKTNQKDKYVEFSQK